jgi:trimethylamine corrinoid protein
MELIESIRQAIEGIVAGISGVGKKFEQGQYFVLELEQGGDLAQRLVAMVEPRLSPGAVVGKGTIVMATVKGDLHDIGKSDLHDIGKSLVSLMFSLAGYNVRDMGVDQATMNIISEAQNVQADIIGLSSLMLVSMPVQMELIRYLNDMGIREKFKVIVGGGPTNQGWADHIGWAPDAVEAVELANKLMAKGG